MKGKTTKKPPQEAVPLDRRSLVRVETKEGDKYPIHVLSVKTGELLGSFPNEGQADFFIDNVPMDRLTA